MKRFIEGEERSRITPLPECLDGFASRKTTQSVSSTSSSASWTFSG
jgi:hypothetical protein